MTSACIHSLYPTDEFMTPPSTPPSEAEESTDGLSQPVDAGQVGKALKSTFDPYDR